MTKRPVLVLILVALALLTLSVSTAQTQGYPFSQRGSVTQMVAFTKISVVYGRPVARGRALFGALVPWDSVWHPGADSATRITFSKNVLIDGKPLGAGEYTLWLIHEMIMSIFHLPYILIRIVANRTTYFWF